MPFGKLQEFDLGEGRNWSAYVRLVKQFILLNEIKPALHVATLVTHVGAATYQLMCDLCAPDNPEDKTFNQLVDLVAVHLEPKRSEIAERHTFRLRRQAEGESVGAFLQNLKHLATHCNFGTTLEVNIRDQFVSGLRSDDMRSRLFAESSLDYRKAVELSLALEAAERHAAEAAAGDAALLASAGGSGLGQGGASASGSGVHRVEQGPRAPCRRPAAAAAACWRCGKGSHAPNKCRYKSYVCDKCSVKGHLAAVCNHKGKDPPGSRYQNFINMDSSDSESCDELYQVVALKRNVKDGPYRYVLSVENINVTFEIDTGSRISAINKSFYDRYFSHLAITRDSNKFHSYTGEAIVPIGYVTVSVQSGNAAAVLPLFVIDNGGPPLLGRSWLRELKLNSISLHHLSTENDPVVIQLKLDFPEVFKSGLGTCKTKLKLYVKDDTPIFCKARVLPLAMRAPVEHELERLLREQVIYKVERSDYGTPIVPVIKRDGSIRLCGDYKLTINKLLKDFHYPLPRVEQLFAALSGGEQYSKIDLILILHTGKSKVEAIARAPAPQNVSQLRAALGLINYYARFIPNTSTLLQPLYALLKKGTRWLWSQECEAAYAARKEALTREPVLAHYDSQLPLVLAVDSSDYGVGAVLSHVYPNGSEHIVACASRTLIAAEQRYSQVDKEALAIVYGVTRHYQYLFGRHFLLKSDHMGLSHIFGPKKGISQTAASRLQRYVVRLAAYSFDIKCVSSERNGNADALSRLPLHKHDDESERDDAAHIHFVEDSFPISHREVANVIKGDIVLRKMYGYIMSGWPPSTEIENEKPFFYRKDDFTPVKHILGAPYHPASNGAAENAVKTVKNAIKKASLEGEDTERALCKFLFQYRNTAHASTQREPAVAMLGRRLRSRLDVLRPRTADFVHAAQEAQVRNAGGVPRQVEQGDQVLVKDFSHNVAKWKPGVVVERTGAVTYKVKSDDVTKTEHIDQIWRKSNRLSLARAVHNNSVE